MADILGLIWAGMVSGCLYALGALGIVLIYKSSNVVNFAHGNLAGLAAFLVFGFTAGILGNMAWGAALMVTLAIMFAVMAVSYFVIAPLVFKSDLTSTIATLGIGLIAQGITQLVFGSNVVSLDLPLPKWSAQIGSMRISAYDMAVLFVTAASVGLLYLLIERTRVGMLIRAGASNRAMVSALGVNIGWLNTFIFALGAGLAGLAGAMVGPIMSVQPGMGDPILITTLVVIVIGGIGSIRGAFLGALVVGVVDTVGRTLVPALLRGALAPEMANTLGPALSSLAVYVLMAVVLALKPDGLFPVRKR